MAAVLYSLAESWDNRPQSWVGSDPCGSNWVGITCSNSHIIIITLPGLGLGGTLSTEIQNLPELVALDLSYNKGLKGQIPQSIGNLVKLKYLVLVGCSFSGNIPPELGKLASLSFLSLNSNNLRGSIPASLGNLSKLTWLDITDNELFGPIPVSSENNLGLNMLTKCKHFHFGKNNLSGAIPPELFHSDMRLLHVLFDSNSFSGSIPSTIGLVQSLTAIRLDRNDLNGFVPSNLNNLTSLIELHLSNNQLTGPLPNLTGMNALAYLDLSNNSFDESEVPPWFSTLSSLTTMYSPLSLPPSLHLPLSMVCEVGFGVPNFGISKRCQLAPLLKSLVLIQETWVQFFPVCNKTKEELPCSHSNNNSSNNKFEWT